MSHWRTPPLFKLKRIVLGGDDDVFMVTIDGQEVGFISNFDGEGWLADHRRAGIIGLFERRYLAAYAIWKWSDADLAEATAEDNEV